MNVKVLTLEGRSKMEGKKDKGRFAHFRVTDNMLSLLRRLAARHDISVSEYCRRVIVKAMYEETKPETKNGG